MANGTSKQLQVYAIKNDSSAAFLAPINGITFASDKTATATVEGGLVVAKAVGTTTIKATITDMPDIDANVIVTVE